MTPGEIQTNETLDFILERITPGPLRVLEVGCGNGALAKRLTVLGHEVVAIDSSAKEVESARRLGVDARQAAFPDFDEAPFDLILFTRSLHHIRPLGAAIDQAHNLLKSDGLLLIEDFAFADTSDYTATWFYSLLKLLNSCGALLPAEESFGRKLLSEGGDISLWREHVHEINTAGEVLEAIGRRFMILETGLAPYLYRYVSAMLPDDNGAGDIIANVLKMEKITGQEIEGFFIGRRFAAKPRYDSQRF